jgi:hypothetical protein
MASAAQAQQTTCFVNGRWINCNTTQSPQLQFPGPQPNYLDTALRARQAREEAERAAAERRAFEASQAADLSKQSFRERVGFLVNTAQCDEAVRVALQAGDFELATQARALCKPIP